MQNRSKKLTVLAAILPALLCVACEGLGVKADLGYAQFHLAGDVALAPTAGNTNLDASKADVEDNLGLDDDMGTPYGRVEASLGIVSATLAGFRVDQTGRGMLTSGFGDLPPTAIETDIDIANVKAAVHFNLLDLGVFSLSPGIGVDVFDMDLSARSALLPALTESVEAVAPVPMLFAQAELDLGDFEAVADIGGIVVDVGDADGTFVDLELVVRFSPFDHVEIFAGYRFILIDVEGDADDQAFLGDITLQGWMIGGGIRF